MLKIFLILFSLVTVGSAGDFIPTSIIKTKSIEQYSPAGGAIEHSKAVLDQIGMSPDLARIQARALPKVGHTSHGWLSYVSQDVTGNWRKGLGYLGGLT
jgi:hypothetical protein